MQTWWAALERPRKIVLAALALMTLSQFFDYDAAFTMNVSVPIVGAGGGDHVEANAATGMAMANATSSVPGDTGWSLHPHAWLILGVLALLFILGRNIGEWWTQWGYWIAVAGLVMCIYPFDLGTPGMGALAGLVAVALGVWAALSNKKQPQAA